MPKISVNSITIDRRSTTNYGIQIKENIKALILNQTFYYQSVLPSIVDLSTHLHIKEKYVKQSYELLIKENYVKYELNEYIVSHIELTNYFFERNTSIYDAVIALGLTPSIKCIEKKVVELSEKEEIEKGFEPSESKQYLYINRIYYGNDQPIIILENYLPLHIFVNLDKEFKGNEPLNNYIGERYGFKAYKSKRVTKIVNLTKELALLLNDRVNAASLQSTNHVFDEQGRMMDYGQSHSVSSYYFQSHIKYNKHN